MNMASVIVGSLSFLGILFFVWHAYNEEREMKFKHEMKKGMPCTFYENDEKRHGVIVDPGKRFTIVRDTRTMKIKRVFTSEVYKPYI